MKDFRKLEIWKRSFDLTLKVYQYTDQFPKEEKFGLTSQTNRSAVSIPSNIAEGSGRNTEKDKAKFIDIAVGSSFELETQLLIAQARKYGDLDLVKEILDELTQIQKMTNSFLQRLRAKS